MLTHIHPRTADHVRLDRNGQALQEQRRSPDLEALSFEERIGLPVDREGAERDTKRLTTRLKFAALRQSACVEDVDLRTPRGIDRAVFARLVGGDWIDRNENLLVSAKVDCLRPRPQSLPRRAVACSKPTAALTASPTTPTVSISTAYAGSAKSPPKSLTIHNDPCHNLNPSYS